MKEDFLQFIWKYKLLKSTQLKCSKDEDLEILNFGQHNTEEGPDFLNACIKYKNMEWVGSIEIHTLASHWELHTHSKNPHYKNVILHVVYEEDKKVQMVEKNNIPTLILKDKILPKTQEYHQQLSESKHKIMCKELLLSQKNSIAFPWLYESWVVEKLQLNTEKINEIYIRTNQDWEATMFIRMAYVLGLKINAEIFQHIAEQIPFSVIRKESENEKALMAILLGKAGLLENPRDDFSKELQSEYLYQHNKYKFSPQVWTPKFFRLRPAAFPSIRLAWSARIYHEIPNLFSKCINIEETKELYSIFKNLEIHNYFNNHYVLGIPSNFTKKKLSKNLLDSIFINAIIPIQYAYYQSTGKDISTLFSSFHSMAPEKNTITTEFEKIGFPLSSALDSQAVLHLYKNYCFQKKCLHCKIGYQLLK